MTRRTQQVAEEIQRIIGTIIQFELKDPRVGFATVTSVTVSNDLQHARVHISVMGDDAQRRETMQGLQSARSYMRRRVGEELRLRLVPEIRLELDTSIDQSIRISQVLREVEEERQRNPPGLDHTDADEQPPEEPWTRQ